MTLSGIDLNCFYFGATNNGTPHPTHDGITLLNVDVMIGMPPLKIMTPIFNAPHL